MKKKKEKIKIISRPSKEDLQLTDEQKNVIQSISDWEEYSKKTMKNKIIK